MQRRQQQRPQQLRPTPARPAARGGASEGALSSREGDLPAYNEIVSSVAAKELAMDMPDPNEESLFAAEGEAGVARCCRPCLPPHAAAALCPPPHAAGSYGSFQS